MNMHERKFVAAMRLEYVSDLRELMYALPRPLVTWQAGRVIRASGVPFAIARNWVPFEQCAFWHIAVAAALAKDYAGMGDQLDRLATLVHSQWDDAVDCASAKPANIPDWLREAAPWGTWGR